MVKTRKLICTIAMALCLVSTLFVFSACGKDDSKVSLETSNVFAMGMVSATNYLEANATAAKSRATVSDETKNTIKEYTIMFEGMLQNGIHPTEGAPTDDEVAKFGEYSKKLSITVLNESYVMYYNEVVEGTEEEIDDKKIETETTSFLYGKVVKGSGSDETIYNVVGSREIESESKKDKTEVENELKLIFAQDELFAADTDAIDGIDLTKLTEYVLIEQETENDEIEFKYTTKFGGVTESVEVEFENEDGKEQLEITLKDGTTKTKYEIKKVNANKYEVKLMDKDGKTKFYLENNDGVWSFSDAEASK